MKSFLIILVVGVLALSAGVLGGYVFHEKGVNSTMQQVLQSANCNSDVECVNSHFKSCAPAFWEISGDLGPVGGMISYRYEIIGAQNNGCLVTSKFTKNPNQALVGQEIRCEYDNVKDFATATQDTSRCSGALYDLMFSELQKPIEAVKQPDGSYKVEDTTPLGTFKN